MLRLELSSPHDHEGFPFFDTIHDLSIVPIAETELDESRLRYAFRIQNEHRTGSGHSRRSLTSGRTASATPTAEATASATSQRLHGGPHGVLGDLAGLELGTERLNSGGYRILYVRSLRSCVAWASRSLSSPTAPLSTCPTAPSATTATREPTTTGPSECREVHFLDIETKRHSGWPDVIRLHDSIVGHQYHI